MFFNPSSLPFRRAWRVQFDGQRQRVFWMQPCRCCQAGVGRLGELSASRLDSGGNAGDIISGEPNGVDSLSPLVDHLIHSAPTRRLNEFHNQAMQIYLGDFTDWCFSWLVNLVSPQGFSGILESGLGVADEEVNLPEFHVRHSSRSFIGGCLSLAGLDGEIDRLGRGARPPSITQHEV